ncbi:MAG TPA: type 1 glutamine amidotransferase [Thermoleophilia bacterium]|nr:type 1 glutamine amidotransferase [Thermoleophilia bacterium]
MVASTHSVIVLQNDSAAPAGIVGDCLRAAGFALDVRRLDDGDDVPAGLSDYDALLVLGGDMNVGEESDYPFLTAERELMAEAVRSGLPTLGICLGAQQLAASGGGGVSRRDVTAFGWRPFAVQQVDDLLAGVDPRTLVFQWRDYACRLPGEAVLLASGDGDPQVFRLGSAAWGIQFHPEVTLGILTAWFEDDPQTVADRAAGGLDGLLAESRRLLPASAGLCRRLVANFLTSTGLASP